MNLFATKTQCSVLIYIERHAVDTYVNENCADKIANKTFILHTIFIDQTGISYVYDT